MTRRRRRPALLALLAALCVVAATHELWLGAIGAWLSVAPNPRHADAIVALGSSPARSDRAAELYLRGFAPELWHTGDEPLAAGATTDARAMVQRAIDHGVPRAATRLIVSRSTWEDGVAIAELARARGVRSILVVTDWHHSRRALCVIQQQLAGSGVAVFYDAPPDPLGGPQTWWRSPARRVAVAAEVAKLAAYWPVHGLDLRRC